MSASPLSRLLPLRVRTAGLCGTDERDLCTIEGRERPHGATVSDPELRRSGLTVRDKVAVVPPGLSDAPRIAAEIVDAVNSRDAIVSAVQLVADTMRDDLLKHGLNGWRDRVRQYRAALDAVTARPGEFPHES